MFQIVKAVADFPRTIYLLSFDRVAVTEALCSEKLTNPEEYLEKIVQAAFDLPEPDPQGLRDLTAELMDGLIKQAPEHLWNRSRWYQCYFGGLDRLIKTPRDLKRLTNAIRPSYPPVRRLCSKCV